MNDSLRTLLLAGHITGGLISLMSGPIALFLREGSRNHKTGAIAHFWGMALTCLTGALMAWFMEIPFLFVVAAFSFYSSFTGYRALRANPYQPGVPEWTAIALGIPACIYMFTTGEIILITFGAFFALQMTTDLRALLQKKTYEGFARTVQFVSRFGGSYIATVTAFLVVNFSTDSSLPMWFWWLIPSVIGSPVLTWIIAREKRRLNAQEAA